MFWLLISVFTGPEPSPETSTGAIASGGRSDEPAAPRLGDIAFGAALPVFGIEVGALFWLAAFADTVPSTACAVVALRSPWLVTWPAAVRVASPGKDGLRSREKVSWA